MTSGNVRPAAEDPFKAMESCERRRLALGAEFA